MAEDSKIRSLTNDLVRRLLTTRESVPDKVRWEIIDDFAQKLLNSGYPLDQTRRIIVAGLKGYEKKLKESSIPGGKKLHRTSQESSASRAWRKLTGKSDWFGDENKKLEQETIGSPPDGLKAEDHILVGWKTGLGNSRVKRKGKTGGTKDISAGWKTRSVLFVPVSRKGILAKRLRNVGTRLNPITGYITKIVECVGKKLKDILPNTNPWSGQECGRVACVPCKQKEEVKINCTKRNLIYESKCMVVTRKKRNIKRVKN